MLYEVITPVVVVTSLPCFTPLVPINRITSYNVCYTKLLRLLEARPYWHGSFLPIYFILSALVSGGAIISYNFV